MYYFLLYKYNYGLKVTVGNWELERGCRIAVSHARACCCCYSVLELSSELNPMTLQINLTLHSVCTIGPRTRQMLRSAQRIEFICVVSGCRQMLD